MCDNDPMKILEKLFKGIDPVVEPVSLTEEEENELLSKIKQKLKNEITEEEYDDADVEDAFYDSDTAGKVNDKDLGYIAYVLNKLPSDDYNKNGGTMLTDPVWGLLAHANRSLDDTIRIWDQNSGFYSSARFDDGDEGQSWAKSSLKLRDHMEPQRLGKYEDVDKYINSNEDTDKYDEFKTLLKCLEQFKEDDIVKNIMPFLNRFLKSDDAPKSGGKRRRKKKTRRRRKSKKSRKSRRKSKKSRRRRRRTRRRGKK